MTYLADLHIHSKWSRACSPGLRPETLHRWCQLKGLTVLATGDFTHPKWFAELKEKLVPAEPGLFQLRPDLAQPVDAEVPDACRAPVRFLLGVEISSIYKRGGRVRKVHNLVFAPSLEAAEKINARLETIGNIRSDGRPILGLDAERLLAIVREASPDAHLIPAHSWTPHFGVFGSESGFDSLEECFGDLAPEVFAVETGLSSDPPMNWRVGGLDGITLISNSDAHSPEKLARETNEINGPLSYDGLFSVLRRRPGAGTINTLEFFPEEGKYHTDGHRACGVSMDPEETLRRNGICRECGKAVTVGVLHRVEKLATRPAGARPAGAADFEYVIPLKEILGQSLGVGPGSRRVDRLYHRLLADYGSEMTILRSLSIERLYTDDQPLLALGLRRMREGRVTRKAGFDGQYGVISVLESADRDEIGQLAPA